MKYFNFFTKLMLISAFMFGGSMFVSARVGVYLSASGDDDNDGTSFDKAYASFSKAMEEVGDGGTIYVSGMIEMYNDPINTQIESGSGYDDTKLGVTLTKSFTIRGESKETSGFTSDEPTDFNEWDDPMLGTAFFRVGTGITLNLQDLTFTKAKVRGKGAVILLNGGKLLGDNLDFVENETANGQDSHTGAAIHCDATTGISLKNCLFYKNKSGKGGAIYIAATNNPNVDVTIESCSFIENVSLAGPTAGAVFFRSGSDAETNNTINMINCTVAKNSSNGNGGAIYIYSARETTVFTFLNCTITENTNIGGTGTRGSGIATGPSVGNSDTGVGYCTILIQNCIIEGNIDWLNGDNPTARASDITYEVSPNYHANPKEVLLISNSFIGRTNAINGSNTYNAGCFVNSNSNYNGTRAGLDAFNEDLFVYPLAAGAEALTYGNAEFWFSLWPFELPDGNYIYLDGINRIRCTFEDAVCSAGAIEGVGVGGDVFVEEKDEIPPYIPANPDGIRSAQLSDIYAYVAGNQLVVNAVAQSLELFSVSGVLVAKKAGNEALSISVSNLQGVYFARIIADGKVYTQKVVIVK